jgi:hypothetical protein
MTMSIRSYIACRQIWQLQLCSLRHECTPTGTEQWSHLLPMKLLLTDSDQMPACCTQSACSLSVPCAKASVSSNVGSSSGDAVLQGFSIVGVQAIACRRRAGKGNIILLNTAACANLSP